MSENNSIHLPDHSFQRFCEKTFGVNRGVYNTIDNWFYDKGLRSILYRRKEILCFFNYVSSKLKKDKREKMKFGYGGLALMLNEYWKKRTINSNSLIEL